MEKKKTLREKLKQNTRMMTIGLGTATLVGVGGLVTGWYLAGSNRAKINDLEDQLANKSDVNDDIIEVKDRLSYTKLYGVLPVMQYNNLETAQVANVVKLDVVADAASTGGTPGVVHKLKYKNNINIISRLTKRGEKFVGTLHASTEIVYIFKKIINTNGVLSEKVVKTIKIVADADGSNYEFATNHLNNGITIKVSEGSKMYIDGSTEATEEVTYAKTLLFPSGNVPSVGVEFIDPNGYPELTSSLTSHEIMRIDYSVHVGYAINRGIEAGKAVYDYLDKEIKALRAQIAGHTHP